MLRFIATCLLLTRVRPLCRGLNTSLDLYTIGSLLHLTPEGHLVLAIAPEQVANVVFMIVFPMLASRSAK